MVYKRPNCFMSCNQRQPYTNKPISACFFFFFVSRQIPVIGVIPSKSQFKGAARHRIQDYPHLPNLRTVSTTDSAVENARARAHTHTLALINVHDQ